MRYNESSFHRCRLQVCSSTFISHSRRRPSQSVIKAYWFQTCSSLATARQIWETEEQACREQEPWCVRHRHGRLGPWCIYGTRIGIRCSQCNSGEWSICLYVVRIFNWSKYCLHAKILQDLTIPNQSSFRCRYLPHCSGLRYKRRHNNGVRKLSAAGRNACFVYQIKGVRLDEGSWTGFLLLQVSLVFVLQINVRWQNSSYGATNRLPIRAYSVLSPQGRSI